MASKYEYSKAKSPHMLMLVLTLAMIMLLSHAMGDDSALEKRKCAEQLTDMATCLPYVGGDAKVPTSDCCSGLIQSIKSNKRCICLIIKDRDDPDLGMKIKLNLALGLPSLCKAPDNFSQCPVLLHLDPKSAEAQAFNQVVQNSNGGSISPSPNPSADEEGSSQNGKGTNETAGAKNCACYKRKRMLISLVAWLLLWFCGAYLK